MSTSQSVTLVRQCFRTANRPLTLGDIRESVPTLKSSQISMTLCYLLRRKYVIREQVDNPKEKERKRVWVYTYSDQRFMDKPEVQDERTNL